MMIRAMWTVCAMLSALAALACLPRDFVEGAPVAPPDAKALRNEPFVADMINQFSVDLYQRLGQEGGNVCFSPYSTVAALTMAYGGAQGETEAQMRRVMRMALDSESLHPAFAALTYGLYARSRDTGYTLDVANAVWGQKDEPFLDSYQTLLKTHYGVGTWRQADFRKNPEQARQAINLWASEQTRGRIRELLAPDTVNARTRLALANAVAFQGRWQEPFDPELTRNMPFEIAPGETVDTPMMRLRASLRYGFNDVVQVVELPYAGRTAPAAATGVVGGTNDLSLFVVLPRERNGLAEVEAQMTGPILEDWLEMTLSAWDVQVLLPRFQVASAYRLNDALHDLGMTLPFDPQGADFSAMTGRPDLYVTTVSHSALVEVDEAGTEAAAATGVVMGLKSLQEDYEVFRADHPFLFVIRDNKEGTFLFLGRVARPNGGA